MASSSSSVSSFQKPTSSKKDGHQGVRRSLLDRNYTVPPTIETRKKSITPRTKAQNFPEKRDDDKSQRTVTFAKTAKVKVVRMRHQYSPKEQEDMWYCDVDYATIKRRAAETVRLMMACEKHNITFLEDELQTARGLENKTRIAAAKRKEFKSFAKELVLNEQHYQKYESNSNLAGMVLDHERIRFAYLEASTVALKEAHERGLKDQEAVVFTR